MICYSAPGFQDDPGYLHFDKFPLFFFFFCCANFGKGLVFCLIDTPLWHLLNRQCGMASATCDGGWMMPRIQSHWHRQLNVHLKITIFAVLPTMAHTWQSHNIMISNWRMHKCINAFTQGQFNMHKEHRCHKILMGFLLTFYQHDDFIGKVVKELR